MSRVRVAAVAAVLHVTAVPALAAQQGLAGRLARVLDAPPFDRATWGVILMDSAGRVLFQRNADRLFVPASNAKLVVAAAGTVLLPEAYRIETSLYATGPLQDGVLEGDLVVYGRGDPTFSARCYGSDTLALGACDPPWARMDALADRLVARGVREITGALVGDGSFFEARQVHPDWASYDLNWWYAAPVSALGFHDDAMAIAWGPGPTVGAPAAIRFDPDLRKFRFENRTRTAPAGAATTIDFFRRPGTLDLWAEGVVAIDHPGGSEDFALPDPNLYFAQALRAALAERGVGVGGPTASTRDSMRYRMVRAGPPLLTFASRPIGDIVFPILNSSQNWFAEMLLKTLGHYYAGVGSWRAGLAVERAFLADSVRVDTAAFHLTDGSGLSPGNLITPRALARVLVYMWHHPRGAPFRAALPRSGSVGSLRRRFVGTPLEGRVAAKTGTIQHVNALSGYLARDRGGPLIFAILVNAHAARARDVVARIDAAVLEAGR